MERLKLSVTDIVAATGESRSNVCRAFKQGHLKSFVVGRRRFARPAAVRDWIDFLESESNAGRAVKYQARATEASHR